MKLEESSCPTMFWLARQMFLMRAMAARDTEWHSWKHPKLLIPSRLVERLLKRRLCGLSLTKVFGVERCNIVLRIHSSWKKGRQNGDRELVCTYTTSSNRHTLSYSLRRFNALIGTMDEITDTHFDILAAFPQLVEKTCYALHTDKSSWAPLDLTLHPTWTMCTNNGQVPWWHWSTNICGVWRKIEKQARSCSGFQGPIRTCPPY